MAWVTKINIDMFYSLFHNKRRKLSQYAQYQKSGLLMIQCTINFDRLVPSLKHRKYKCMAKRYCGTEKCCLKQRKLNVCYITTAIKTKSMWIYLYHACKCTRTGIHLLPISRSNQNDNQNLHPMAWSILFI